MACGIRQVGAVQTFTSLAIRLAENKRPSFTGGVPLDQLAAKVKELQTHEQECGADLYKELERQWRLARTDKKHTTRCVTSNPRLHSCYRC